MSLIRQLGTTTTRRACYTEKTDAGSRATTYTYTRDGRLETRAWARQLSGGGARVTTTYVYDPRHERPEPRSRITSSTPGLGFTHTRDGRIDTVSDGTGTREFAYDEDTLALETEDLPDDFFGSGRDVGRQYASGVGGRLSGLPGGHGVRVRLHVRPRPRAACRP